MDVKTKAKTVDRIKSAIKEELSCDITRIKDEVILEIKQDLQAEISKYVASSKNEVRLELRMEMADVKIEFQKEMHDARAALQSNIADIKSSIRQRLVLDDKFKGSIIDDIKADIIRSDNPHIEGIRKDIMDALRDELVVIKKDLEKEAKLMKDSVAADLRKSLQEDVNDAMASASIEVEYAGMRLKRAWVANINEDDKYKLVSAIVYEDGGDYDYIAEVSQQISQTLVGAIYNIIASPVAELSTVVWCKVKGTSRSLLGMLVCQCENFPMYVEVQEDQNMRFSNTLGKIVRIEDNDLYLDCSLHERAQHEYLRQVNEMSIAAAAVAATPPIIRRDSSVRMRRSSNSPTADRRTLSTRRSSSPLSRSVNLDKIYKFILIKYSD